MAQLDLQEVFARIAQKAQDMGLECHSEERGGESCVRFQIGKSAKDPKSLLQGGGAYVTLNLPGDSDRVVVGVGNTLGLGNSSGSEVLPKS